MTAAWSRRRAAANIGSHVQGRASPLRRLDLLFPFTFHTAAEIQDIDGEGRLAKGGLEQGQGVPNHLAAGEGNRR